MLTITVNLTDKTLIDEVLTEMIAVCAKTADTITITCEKTDAEKLLRIVNRNI